MSKNDIPKGVKCSFCGKTQESVRKIIAGPGVYICNECIGLCNAIIETEYYADDEDTYTLAGLEKIPSPKEIKEIFVLPPPLTVVTGQKHKSRRRIQFVTIIPRHPHP